MKSFTLINTTIDFRSKNKLQRGIPHNVAKLRENVVEYRFDLMFRLGVRVVGLPRSPAILHDPLLLTRHGAHMQHRNCAFPVLRRGLGMQVPGRQQPLGATKELRKGLCRI